MNRLQRWLKKVDDWQQSHTASAFMYAVIKKYGDDEASYQGALITYYGFLSLFPLLIVATSVVQLISNNNAAFKARVVNSVGHYIPIIGDQLERSIHSPHKTGLALIISILITLYGARGVADAFRHALDHIWQIPHPKRTGFPKNVLKSLGIIVIGGIGFISAAIISGAATSLGHGFIFRVLAVIVSILIIFLVFIFLFTQGVSTREPKAKDIIAGALTAAIGLQILQVLGGYIITHQLSGLTSIYGTFAVVLGLLFWIYLQVQVVLYAVEIDSVRKIKLWPRSLLDPIIPPDKKAYRKYAEKEAYKPNEDIDVSFDNHSLN